MKYFHLKSLLTVLLSLCCAVVSAQSFESNGISYSILSLSDRTVEVAHNANYQGFIIIPSTADYSGISFKVTGIGNGAFTSTKVTEMILSEGVTYIGNNAFNFSSLKEIIIPNSVTSIGEYAFRNCTGLKSITIPNSVTSIENYTFEYCTGLTSITIPNSVTSIGDYAFRGCTGITSVTIPNSVTSIEENAFYGCTKLKLIYNDSSLNLTIGSSQYGYVAYYAKIVITNKNDYTIVDDYIFNKTDGVYTLIAYVGIDSQISLPLEINGTNYVIGKSAFSGCTELSHITIPNNVTTIGQYAFSNCTNLTSVTIPNGITKVENSTFSGCTSLTSVTIPNSVTTIGQYAFSNCTSLGSLEIPNSVTRIEIGAFDNCRCLSSIKIPNGITSIANNTFQSCRWLTRVTIPNSVTTIGDGAFNLCGLTSVVIPNSVTSIGSNAFSQCSNLTSVTIPNSVTSIGSGAFWECSGLKSITIPNSVTSIGQNVFSGCTSLTSVTIPNSVTSIGQSAFSSCTGLTSVIIPNSVTTIGSSAFWGCSGLKSVTIPNSVTSIGSGAFEGCTGLTAVHISNFSAWCKIDFRNAGYTNDPIKSNPLYYAKNLYLNGELLTDLVIPNGITEIKKYAFYCCSSLRSITIPNSITTIEERAFESCSGLTSVTIPNSVTTIGNYAFDNCSSLASVTIPNSVTTIGGYAFSGCTGLTSVTIPNSVKWIGDYAFYGCTGLAELYVKATEPPTIYSKTFNKYTATLHVPTGSKTAYQAADYWKEFTNIEEFEIKSEYGDIVFKILSTNDRTCEITFKGSTYDEVEDEYTGNIVIPEKITFIGEEYTVTSIAANAFSGCTGLTSITIPNSVTSIGDYAFASCSSLASVTIPNSVTKINDSSFDNCTALKNMHIEDASTALSLGYDNNPSSATGKGQGLFYDSPLVTLYIGRDLSYPASNNAGYSPFMNKRELTSLTIGDKVTSIGENAFAGCSGLTNVTIGASVTTIGLSAFSGCFKLTHIKIKAKTPPTKSIDNRFISVFDDYSATLYVPKGTKTAYQTASVWKNFKNIVEIEEEEPATPGDITGDGIVNVGDITTIASMILDESLMNDAADINNDGIVNVGDITTLVSMILGSNSAPARAAVTGEVALPVVTASMDADNSILINVANPDYPFTAAQFDLSFEGGIGIVNDGEYYDVFLGSRTSSRNHSEPECNTQPDGSLRVVILSLKNKVFDGEEGDIATVALDVTGVADGVYQYTIKNIALSDPNSQLQYPADATGMITVNGGVISAVTGINSITADGENANEAIYDLSGRKVANPGKGIYIVNGKKVIF